MHKFLRLLKQALNGEEQDYTSGSIDRAIVLLSIPMILEMAMESLFAIVDAFFVAKIGTEAVATVGLTESVLTLVYSLAIGLSAAATAMVSRRVGEGDRDAAAKAGAQAIVIALILSVLVAVPGFFYAKEILLLMSKDKAVAENGYRFTQLMLTCNLPIFLLWMLNGIFRGAGDAATAMRALWIANIVNIILCPTLINGWGPFPALGVTGSAVATTIGRSIGVVYQLWNLFGVGKIVRLRWTQLRPDKVIMGKLMEIAAGSTGQYLISSASWIFMIFILGQISKEVTAGYTIAIRIIIFTILPSWGVANAAATLVGQNLGAGHPDRAEKSVWRACQLNLYFMAFVGITYFVFAPQLIGIFTHEAEAVQAGTMGLRVLAAGYVFFGYGMIMSQALNGAGDTKTPTWINFIFFWLIETPLAWVWAMWIGWGQMGVYASIFVAESLMALAMIWAFKRGKWKLVEV
jgi:putative MATE family efflux protein